MQTAQTYVVLATQECIIESREEILTDIYKNIFLETQIHHGIYNILIVQCITFEIDTFFFSWLMAYLSKMVFSPMEVDYDKWTESAALTSWVTFQVTCYSHWAFLFLELTASEEWVAEILLWVPSISFSLLKTVYMGLNCWCLYQEKGILVSSLCIWQSCCIAA